MKVKNIIIQAGGLGSRLLENTKNKPKCLVPINGKPIVQHILEKNKDCNFIIIGDYKVDILRKYVKNFYKEYNISIVETHEKGTCAGISDCSDLINANEPVAVIWSDLLLEEELFHDNEKDINVFLSDDVVCRYVYKENEIIKETNNKNGIVGVFTFKNSEVLKLVPPSGSLVSDWIKNINLEVGFKKLIRPLKEIGTIELLEKNSNKLFCRFFNNIEIKDDKIIKTCKDIKYRDLLEDEKIWYKYILSKNKSIIPEIFSLQPLIMEYIYGKQGFSCNFSKEEKIVVLKNIANLFNDLHSLETIQKSDKDIKKVYVSKTLERIEKVKDVIPFFDYEEIISNGIKLKNPFHEQYYSIFLNAISSLNCDQFHPIHGDPTFSNLLIEDNLSIKMIDPRGSFGDIKIYGDKDYDWAKLYYSMIGNYDSINSKKYNLEYSNNIINYSLNSNGWEFLEEQFYELSLINKQKNLLLNSIIWLSLCGYVIEDYDAILISFIKGVEYWNKIY